MAVLCRCGKHAPQNNRLHIYKFIGQPVGYPKTSSICGARRQGQMCQETGLIYMTADAVKDYNKGRRIFNYASNVTQVRLNDVTPIPRKD